MAERLLPAKKWMSKEKHRGFCWRLLAQCALANGWTENQAEYLLAAWRHQHGFNFHDVELASALNTALEATTAVREKYRLEKNRKMEDKTSYRVLEFLATGESTPAEVARGLSMDRVTIKQCLYRLAKAGRIQKLGGGRYSTVTPTVTQEVKDKKRKVKNSYSSLTKIVTVGVTDTLPFQPGKTQEDPHELGSPVTIMSYEERYLRQIRCIERPDGTFEIDPPDEIAVEQDQKLRDDFDRWQKDLDAFSRARPKTAERRPIRSLLLPVGDFQADPAPRSKEASEWTSSADEYQSGLW
jgi:predicted transcriptional regulator